MKYQTQLKALFLIVNAGFADDVIDIAREVGVRGATIINARGASARQQTFMGIPVNSEKEMILCIVETEIAEKTMRVLKEKAGITTPAHCIGFTMPVENMVGIDTKAYAPNQ